MSISDRKPILAVAFIALRESMDASMRICGDTFPEYMHARRREYLGKFNTPDFIDAIRHVEMDDLRTFFNLADAVANLVLHGGTLNSDETPAGPAGAVEQFEWAVHCAFHDLSPIFVMDADPDKLKANEKQRIKLKAEISLFTELLTFGRIEAESNSMEVNT